MKLTTKNYEIIREIKKKRIIFGRQQPNGIVVSNENNLLS